MVRLLLALLLSALPAAAQALLTPGEQVERELTRALAAGDESAATALLHELGPLYHYPASEQEARDLLTLATNATRSKQPAVVEAALRALGKTGAPQAAGVVSGYLRKTKPRREERAIVLAAVAAAEEMRSPALAAPLLQLAKTSTDSTVADQALLALGSYCSSPANLRLDLAGKTLDAARALKRERKRWRRLRAPALRALQRLMGRRINSLDQFGDYFKVLKERKRPFG